MTDFIKQNIDLIFTFILVCIFLMFLYSMAVLYNERQIAIAEKCPSMLIEGDENAGK